MNIDSLLEILNRKLIEDQQRPLNEAEILILRGIWQHQTYSQIAGAADYSSGYFTNVVAPELCRRLSAVLGRRVTKKNARVLLESYVDAQAAPEPTPAKEPPAAYLEDATQEQLPCYPSGAVSLDSPFYIERSLLEEQVYREIRKPGALVRIKGAREMGKTSLLLRILDYARHLNYHTISLNLEQVDQAILEDLNQFLRWLSANAARQLQLTPNLDEYWDEDLGSKISCTSYFQDYLLEQIDSPLVLALDEVNQVFEHPSVAKDFLPLLRSWYEEAKTLPLWQKLRLIVVHSTEIYVPLQLNQSPFNVGLPVQLNSFSQEEVQQLAGRYGLDWLEEGEIGQLMALVGGHPALVHIALYHLSREEVTLAQLLETAPTARGIYDHHLQRHWVTLKEQPELARALDTVMKAAEPVRLDPVLTYKLSSLGLIERSGEYAIPGCELYRRYLQFQQQQPSRRRGVILTTKGLEKLQNAKSERELSENAGKRYTLEELSEQTGLSIDTVGKLLAAEVTVDRQSLKSCFRAFNLVLERDDFRFPTS